MGPQPEASGGTIAERSIDAIYNITNVCPYSCTICCQDAVYVGKSGANLVMQSAGGDREAFARDYEIGDVFEQATLIRQARGLELDLAGKFRVLDNLAGRRTVRVDFSGGDPLLVAENLRVIHRAAELFGRHGVTVTATGAGLARVDADELATSIGELNITYDGQAARMAGTRPGAYAAFNLRQARPYALRGVSVRAECPLTTANIDPSSLRSLYQDLHDAGVGRLLLMRLFPVGRGAQHVTEIPTRDQYLEAIEVLKSAEARLVTPRVSLQCALRFVTAPSATENPCDLMRSSFGVMADGRMLASAWAISSTGQPLDGAWVLGNLAETPLSQILETPRAQLMLARLDDNFGHCKVQAYLNSGLASPLKRMFDKADPLYVESPLTEVA